jgi:hypothetical protein
MIILNHKEAKYKKSTIERKHKRKDSTNRPTGEKNLKRERSQLKPSFNFRIVDQVNIK